MARAANDSKTRRKPVSSYDRLKEFGGQKYTGMKVGRGHHWTYDSGEWIEKKVTPDKWEFEYAVKKRRHGKAPEGSGVPVGTAYRWYILAEQVVTKLDANSYTTAMKGTKFKLSHKRADKPGWAASEQAQKKRLVQLLREMIADLEKEPVEIAESATAMTAHRETEPQRRSPATPRRRRQSNGHATVATRARPTTKKPQTTFA